MSKIGFDESFKILTTHFFGEFGKVITDYEIIKLPKKADVLVVETEKPIAGYVNVFDYFKKFNIIEFKSVNDPFRIDKDISKIMVYCGGILLNEKQATFDNTTFTILSARKPLKFLMMYKKHIQKVKNGVYLIKGLVQVPVYIMAANEVKHRPLSKSGCKRKKTGNIDKEIALIKEFSTGVERVRFIETVLHEALNGNHGLKEYLTFAFSLYKHETYEIIKKEGVSMTIVEKNIREWFDELGLKDKYKKEGKKEGKIEGKIETAINMKKEGFDTPLIAKITGLPQGTIEKL